MLPSASPPSPTAALAPPAQLTGAALWRKRALHAALPATYACVVAMFVAAVVRFAATHPGAPPERHVVAWFVAALFVGVALPLSVGDILGHVLHYVSPLQRLYIRILWLVPIFAVDAWLALRYKEQALFINTARECYEAFVIYSFFSLLLEFLGPRERTLQLLAAKARRTGHDHAHCSSPSATRGPGASTASCWTARASAPSSTWLCASCYPSPSSSARGRAPLSRALGQTSMASSSGPSSFSTSRKSLPCGAS